MKTGTQKNSLNSKIVHSIQTTTPLCYGRITQKKYCVLSVLKRAPQTPRVCLCGWSEVCAAHSSLHSTHTLILTFKLGLRLLLLGDAGCMTHPSLNQKYSPTQTPLPHPWQAVAPLHCLKGQDRPLVACLLSVHRALDNGCLLNEADNWKKEDVVPPACFSHLLSAEPLYFFFLFSFLFHVGLNTLFIPSNSYILTDGRCWIFSTFWLILSWEVEMKWIFLWGVEA